MSRKIYNRLSFMAVSWLDESTLAVYHLCLTPASHGSSVQIESTRLNSHPPTRTPRNRVGLPCPIQGSATRLTSVGNDVQMV